MAYALLTFTRDGIRNLHSKLGDMLMPQWWFLDLLLTFPVVLLGLMLAADWLQDRVDRHAVTVIPERSRATGKTRAA